MRLPRFRRPRLGDVVRIDGKLHIVQQTEWPGGWTHTEPLADVLARNMLVGSHSTTLAQALVEAGWQPPAGEPGEPLEVVCTIENDSDFPGIIDAYGPLDHEGALACSMMLQMRGFRRGETCQVAQLKNAHAVFALEYSTLERR